MDERLFCGKLLREFASVVALGKRVLEKVQQSCMPAIAQPPGLDTQIELFTEAEIDRTDEQEILLAQLARRITQQKGSMSVWKARYEEWKESYRRFRQIEDELLYRPAGNDGQLQPSAGRLRGHLRAVFILLEQAEILFDDLSRMPVASGDQQERHRYLEWLVSLMESLGETCVLWHKPLSEPARSELLGIFAEA